MFVCRGLVGSVLQNSLSRTTLPAPCRQFSRSFRTSVLSMATAQEVKAALRELLPTLDINTTTERKIREQLAQQIGPIDEHKKLIKQEIDNYLTETYSQPQTLHSTQQSADAGTEPGSSKRKAASPDAPQAAKAPRVNYDVALPGIQLGMRSLKFANINEFKGQKYVNLREYFKNRETGDLAPTRKGIMLTPQQWMALQGLLPQLQQAVEAGNDTFDAELGNKIRVTTSTFQGKLQIGIREYYEDGGQLKPGQKGINLTSDAFKDLLDAVPELTKQLGAAATAAAQPPAAAAPKPAAAAAAPRAGAAPSGSSSDEAVIELGGKKRAAISMFTGKPQVDLREVYEKDGKMCPGKKGILLRQDQWDKICEAADAITAAVQQRNATYKLDLGNKRQVSPSEFKGTWYVNVREYYEKDGQLLPGQKGLSMNLEQWNKLVAGMDKLNAALKR